MEVVKFVTNPRMTCQIRERNIYAKFIINFKTNKDRKETATTEAVL